MLAKTKPTPAAASSDAKEAPASSSSAAAAGGGADDGYNKYRKMLKIGQPKQSVANKMRQDGIDSSIIEDFEESGVLPNGNAMQASGGGISAGASKSGAAAALAAHLGGKKGDGAGSGGSGSGTGKLTDEEEKLVAKYRKMLKIHMPQQSVINRMRQDGVDKNLIDKMFGSGSASSGIEGSGAKKTKKKEEPS